MNEQLKDKYGLTIHWNDSVEVGEPAGDEMHNHSFVGTAVGFRNGNVIVEDQDGDCFEVDPENVEVNR